MRSVCSLVNTAKQNKTKGSALLSISSSCLLVPFLKFQWNYYLKQRTKCLQLKNPFQFQGHMPRKSHFTDFECAFLLESEVLLMFASMITSFREDGHFNFLRSRDCSHARTSQIFPGLQDELDQNSTGTFHGAAFCQPASLTCSLLGLWANWKSVQRLSNEAGRKILRFSPNQNKRIFLRS